MLKVSEAKLKNSKLNIDLKFRKGNDYLTEIKKFLANLTEDNFRLNRTGDAYIFVLDNKYTRMCIENVLKKSGNTGNVYLSGAIVVENNCLFTIPVAAVAGMIPGIVVLFVAEVFIHFRIQDTLIEATCQQPQKPVFAGQFIFRHSMKVQLIEHQVDYVFFFFLSFGYLELLKMFIFRSVP